MASTIATRVSRNETVSAAWGVWSLLIGMGLIMLGNGLQGTLLGVRASGEGFGDSVTGFVMSGYFIGFLAGSTITTRAVQRVGHVRVFAALASIASIAILVHSIFVTPLVWGLMRVMTGFAYAGLYVVTESWLNDRATNELRGRLFSVYMVVSYLGMGGGQLLLNVSDPGSHDLFILVSIIVSLALVPILLSATRQPDSATPEPLSMRQLYRISPLGTVGCFATGIANGTIFGMGAVYARTSGLTVSEVSIFMGALIVGGAIFQWPIGKLSDRIDRRKVITVVALSAAVLAAAAVAMARVSDTGLLLLALALGGTVLTLYSLFIAYTNDHLEPRQMVAASSGLVLATGIGAILGPSTTGLVMDLTGPDGFLWYLSAIHVGIAAFSLYRMTRRAAPTAEEQSSYVVTATRTSPLGSAWVEEAAGEEGILPEEPGEDEPSSGRDLED
ncbi:MFS transporter [Ferruginivarius sediminum]|uniref:MFS transporter n=1 Tax=Ferruginivarius sediminum TaxID=2661937 RepID=A0A369T864_9PROT|nr:MFS transporter [Ferruginivarius sediminum]RDD60367.1 MFS transporter [Ferruginivarius sediminum]